MKEIIAGNYCFEELSEKTLEQSLYLINRYLKPSECETPREELEESVWPGKHAQFLLIKQIVQPKYWVMLESEKVIGVTGYYFYLKDIHDTVWGGWTVIDRNKMKCLGRINIQLCRKTLHEAKKTNKKYINVLTDDTEECKRGNQFFDKVGCHTIDTKVSPDGMYNIITKRIELNKSLKILEKYRII